MVNLEQVLDSFPSQLHLSREEVGREYDLNLEYGFSPTGNKGSKGQVEMEYQVIQ